MSNDPGKYPFTRGIYKNMYKDKLWTMRQYSGFTSAQESNKRYQYLISQGVTGLSVAFDLPTQIGYDSDHIMSEGEVGKVGVPITSIHDMEKLFKDINLKNISTSMTINSTAAILLSMYIVLAEKNKISIDKLNGTIQNDILKEYLVRGTYIYPPNQSMRLITDIFSFCEQHMPKWNPISISGYHIREAGSTAAQELAKHEITVNSICPGITYTNILSNIVKKRALEQNKTEEEIMKHYVRDIPLKRPNNPEDIASMVVFLSSEGARNISGQSYNVDGGLIPS